jgi:oxygen-dependent protoporphyrinogen oxidase
MRRVVIIGGGISGLAAAHRQIESSGQSVEVLLLEANPRLGGVISTEHRDGFLIEGGPDSFISEKPEAIELAKRIGLSSNLIETNKEHRRSFIVRGGKLCPVPEGFHLLAPARIWPFLTSNILSLSGKARLALDLFLPRVSFANGEADESLASFVRRRLGREALERVAQPMVGGIYTADPEQLSLRATMPRFLEMEREHGSLIRAMWKAGSSATVREGSVTSGTSGARYSLFLSFDGGMQMLTDRLGERIAHGSTNLSLSDIRLNTKVEELTLDVFSNEGRDARWKVRTNNDTITADEVCLALPAYASARLLRNLDDQLAAELDDIPYASTATINLAYRRADIPHPLDGFGFVVPFIEKRTLMACTFSSVKFANRAPHGHALLRAFVGGGLQPDMFELDEDEMIRRVRDDLRQLLGIESAPLFAQVVKWPRSMPQYHVGHLERVKRIEQLVAALPGLALAGNAFHGPGIPDCIRSGETSVLSR